MAITFAANPAASPAAITHSPFTSNLTVLGAYTGGENNLTYTWDCPYKSGGNVSFSANASNAAKNTTVTFISDGSYLFRVTISATGQTSVFKFVWITVENTPKPTGGLAVTQDTRISGTFCRVFGQLSYNGYNIWDNVHSAEQSGLFFGALVTDNANHTSASYYASFYTLTVTDEDGNNVSGSTNYTGQAIYRAVFTDRLGHGISPLTITVKPIINVSESKVSFEVTAHNTSVNSTITGLYVKFGDLIFSEGYVIDPYGPNDVLPINMYGGPNIVYNYDPSIMFFDLSNNTSIPNAGIFAIVNTDVTKLRRVALYSSNATVTDHSYRVASSYSPTQQTTGPMYELSLAAGETENYTIEFRFAPSGSTRIDVCEDVYTAWAEHYPETETIVNWTDRRPVIAAYPAGSNQLLGLLYEQLYGIHLDGTGPDERYCGAANLSNHPEIPVNQYETYFQSFRTQLLAYGDSLVSFAQTYNAQGVMFWNLETDQYNFPTNDCNWKGAYVGDLRAAYTTTPALAYVYPGNTLTVMEELFKKLEDAGLKYGCTVRFETYSYNGGYIPDQLIGDLPEHGSIYESGDLIENLEEMSDKIDYCKSLGCSLFYCDSTVFLTEIYHSSWWKALCERHSDVVLFPEQVIYTNYQCSLPYRELRNGYITLDNVPHKMYPHAGAFINSSNSNDVYNIVNFYDQSNIALQQGAIIVYNLSDSVNASTALSMMQTLPTIETEATVDGIVHAGIEVNLSALGDIVGGEDLLTYTWSVVGDPSITINFGENGSNEAKNTTVMFSNGGTYTIRVTISGRYQSVTSDVEVTVLDTPDVVVLYRDNHADSLAFAEYYQSSKTGYDIILLAVPCSGNEILANYTSFQNEIEDAVKTSFNGIKPIVIVGYGVPGGFYDGSDVISATSRLSRLYHDFTKGLENPLFSRQQYQQYDSEDSDVALIVSRIDAPSLEAAKAIVDNIGLANKQGVANGTLFFDPYTQKTDDEETDYQNELFDFQIRTFPVLNMKTYVTTSWDSANTNVVIPKLKDDSFMWSWKADRAGFTFFDPKTTARMFLYNADTDGGASVRDVEDKRWPMLALNAGYAATAGAMSDPLPEGFIRPKVFFEALLSGANIGEAFLYSVPNLDWTVTLFGDPLLKVKFPRAKIVTEGYTAKNGFDLMGKHLQSAIAYYFQREQQFVDIYETLHGLHDVSVATELLTPFAQVGNEIISKTKLEFVNLVELYAAFPITTESLSQWLAAKDSKISSLLGIISPIVVVPSRLLYTDGYWDFTTTIVHTSSDFAKYSFQLQLANDENFADLIDTGISYTTLDNLTVNADSYQNADNWVFEKNANEFTELPSSGVLSSYRGRMVRYIPSDGEYFAERKVYYIRYRQVDEFGEPTSWQVYKQVVGT